MFRTELPLVPAPQQLPLSAHVLTIGSCFSDTIGSRLAAAKVDTLVNPFGTVFSPVAACKLLRAAAGEDTDWQQHLVEARGRWQSYDLHASIGANSPVEVLQQLQQLLRNTGVFLATADVVVLTLGTAWTYRLKETEELVSNCHKMPAEKFDKELLTPDEIINAVAETHAYLRLRNPKLRFVLTVSPVRHLKDTLPLNAVSKSVLRVACHYLSELLPDVSYFPAYELLLDDLRDYRFYAADMLHPSPVAEDYIWERFARMYFDVDFGRFRKEWEAVRQALGHRPLHPAAPEHREFLVDTLERLEKLSGRADMRMEILEVRRQLQNLPAPILLPTLQPDPEDDEERIDIGTVSSLSIAAQEHNALISGAIEPALEEESNEADDLAESVVEAGQPKKKRRSRGGAKRNKKKNTARLTDEGLPALEATAEPEMGLVEGAIGEETLPAPATTLVFDPEGELQTAMERRKRGSRRNRGGRKLPEVLVAADVTPDDVLPTPLPADSQSSLNSDSNETALLVAEAALMETEQPETTVASDSQRPVRTGRSASEVRAAALRKPRRPDSRIKTLYATPPATPSDSVAAPAPMEAPQPEILSEAPVSTSAEDSLLPLPAPAPVPTVEAPRPPVVSAIPMVRGTGASGRLSATGKATLTTGPIRPKPRVSVQQPLAEPLPSVADTQPNAIVADAQPNAEVPETELAAASQPDTSADVASLPESVEPVGKPAPVKPKRRPVEAATQKSAALKKVAAIKPKASKPAAKPKKKAEATAKPPTTETPATASGPAPRRRKPIATPPTPPATAAVPKRAPRRKPAAPDDLLEIA